MGEARLAHDSDSHDAAGQRDPLAARVDDAGLLELFEITNRFGSAVRSIEAALIRLDPAGPERLDLLASLLLLIRSERFHCATV